MSFGEFLGGHLWQGLGLLVLLACSAFASGSETALFSLSRGQLYRLAHQGAAGRLAAALMKTPRRTLNALLMLNMLVNVAYAGTSALLVVRMEQAGFAHWSLAAAAVAALLVLILAGEVVPKIVAFAMEGRWAVWAAPVLTVVEKVLRPLLWVLDRAIVTPLTLLIAPRAAYQPEITAEELGALLDLSAKQGLIDRDANELLQEIVELTDLRVGDIMVPRVDVVAYDVDDPPAGLIGLLARTRLRKIPVYRGDIDHVLGVIQGKRLLLEPGRPLEQLVVKAPFVPESANVERLLVQFRVTRTQLAIVVDEFGGMAGLVSLQDVLEEIVGDLPDPRDRQQEAAVQRLGAGRYLVEGDLAIHDWADLFGIDLSGRRISTVGGFVVSLLGHIPRVGEQAAYRNLRFTVHAMRGRRVSQLLLELEGEPA
jgi:CBS domain containing-hemolysin-like protein